MTEPGEFSGRTALVTGGRVGIGRAVVDLLAARGARVLVGGRRHDEVDTAVAQIRAVGGDAAPFVADIADPAALRNAFETASAAGPRPDILIANVGVRDRHGVRDLDTARFAALIHTDLTATYDTIRAFLDTRAGRPASVVLLSSVAARLGRAGDVGYAAAKAGIEGMTRSLATELGPDGIRVNAVAPGMIATASNVALAADDRIAGLVRDRTALGRWGEPTEVAEAVAFLASDRASYITGQTLSVDAGFSTLF